jgi:hypothetical protein
MTTHKKSDCKSKRVSRVHKTGGCDRQNPDMLTSVLLDQPQENLHKLIHTWHSTARFNSQSNTNLIHFLNFLVLMGFNASTCFGRHSPIFRRPCINATWCNCVRKMCVGGVWVGVIPIKLRNWESWCLIHYYNMMHGQQNINAQLKLLTKLQ